MRNPSEVEIPFTTFRGTLKQLRLDDLEPWKRDLFCETFPRFFTSPPVPADSAQIREKLESISPKFRYRESAQSPRRFAGEPPLGRGRYYTVCRTDCGDDGGALRNEVSAYRDPVACGRVQVSDSRLHVNPFTGENNDALLVVWWDGVRSKFHQHLRASQGREESGTRQVLALEFPYELIPVALSGVLDLRYPHVRRWFFSTFSCERAGDASSVWATGSLLQSESDEVKAAVRALSLTRPSRFRVVAEVPPVPKSFADMLPTLLNPDLGGGSPADSGSSLEAVATTLRQNGVSAVIYPSARSDASVVVANGEIADFSGWCLVDYRGDRWPRNQRIRYIEQSPWCWTGFAPGIHLDAEDGGFGSFRVHGMEQYWHREYDSALAGLESVTEHPRSKAFFGEDGVLTNIGAWYLGVVSVEWVTRNAVEGDPAGALNAWNLLKGLLLHLGMTAEAGLLDELQYLLPRDQNISAAVSQSLDVADRAANALSSVGADQAAMTLVTANRLHALRFFVSLHLKARRAAWAVPNQAGCISQLLGELDVGRSGLSAPFQERVGSLFRLGMARLSSEPATGKHELGDYEKWVQEVNQLDPQ